MFRSWYDLVGTFTGVVALTVAALPVAVLTVCVLAYRRRASGASRAWAWRSSLADVGIVYGTIPGVWLILLPGDHPGAAARGRMNLVPLRDLLMILEGSPGTAVGQIVGNLLVFAALGFLIPLRVAALASVPRALALAAGCSALVEVAQYVLRLDRVT
ncbi:VanZ family protein, partial [Spirillospora sp. NPDC049652]